MIFFIFVLIYVSIFTMIEIFKYISKFYWKEISFSSNNLRASLCILLQKKKGVRMGPFINYKCFNKLCIFNKKYKFIL